MTATFTPASGLLTVNGDALGNTITVSRDAAGKILVNGGAVAVAGGTPTVANTSLMQVFGQDGNDVITLSEANGALPAANLFGGGGNDTLTGGSGNDQLFGQAGNDTLLGKGGNDQLFGGADDDVLTGGTGDDQVFGEAGNDRMIWNPGEGTDLNEGGDGTDTVEVNGGNGAETFTVTPNGTRVRFDRVTPAPFSIDIGTSENLVLNANGGDDTFTAGNGLATLISLTVDGGAGNDTLTGGDGNDVLLGGDGNDFVTGGRGSDVVLLGANDDEFTWNPGDGSDTVEGQDGFDRMNFNGANIAERFDLSANGTRMRFTRDVANIVMDLNGIEGINLAALGGADTLTVNDLTGTALLELNVNLAASAGGGDGAADTVIVNATAGADTLDVLGGGAGASVVGLPGQAQVGISNTEGANDSIVVNGLGGNDTISANVPAATVKLAFDGGAGDDTLRGSLGNDVLIGGDGNDTVDGNQGNDTVFLGIGDDTFQWDPGDGSDVVEGQDGADRMVFNGANVAENFDVSANGTRVRFFRDVANIVMDLAGVEVIDLNALGGADSVVVNDLTGTDLSGLDVDLRAAVGGGDGAVDTVVVNATAAADTFTAISNAGGIVVSGLQARVNLIGAEAANDRLTLNGAAGDDAINASGVAAGAVQLALSGGPGADLLVGSPGDDLVTAGQGNDTALMGAGDDTFTWNPGDGSDIVEGQAGTDRMVFNGANIAEKIDVSANGGRVRFTRDIAAIVMDLNDTESIDFNALGGADSIVVNDLSGTDLMEVNVNLAAAGGAGDAFADTVTVNGTAGGDGFSVAGSGAGASVIGLAVRVNVAGGDGIGALAVDRVVVNGLDGEDHFTVVPSAGVEIDVDGQAPTPPAVPGDTLTVLTAGTSSPAITVADTPAGKQGVYTFADRQLVRFSDIERLDDDLAGAVHVTGVFVTGPGLSGGSPTTGQAAFRTAAGIDSTFGYPVPDGKGQLRSLPWISGVSQVSLRLDRDVSGRIDESDLSVRGVAVDKYGFKGFGYDPATRTATWVLTGPVTQDKLLLVLDAGRVAGLDGEWANGADAFPSGDGLVGGSFDFRVNVLRGDATGDGSVNALDLAAVRARLFRRPGDSGYSVFSDVTMDGVINALDQAGVRQTLNRKLPLAEPAALVAALLL